MAASYIPTTDALLVPWLDNFSALITADPTAYGFTSGDASSLDGLVSTYETAYSAAIAGATRGPTTVAIKDAARANVVGRSRQLAILIQANPSITEAQKTALGVTVRKTTRTPVVAPTTSPLLSFVAATPGQHTLRMADQMTPAARTKPFGVIALQLNVWIYTPITPPPPPGPPSPPSMTLIVTKNPFAVNFDSTQARMVAYYLGYWQTRTGLLGPVSNAITQIII